MTVRVDRSWVVDLDCSASALWAALEDTTAYPRWWPWLDADELPPVAAGAHARVTIRPPLPYGLAADVRVTEVVEARSVAVEVTGDLVGSARLAIEERGPDASRARLDFALAVDHDGLRGLPATFDPLLRLGHEVVMRRGIRQFHRATGLPPARRAVPSSRQRLSDALLASGVGALVSGAPSTVHALATGGSLLEGTRAAGTVLGRRGVVRGLAAHTLLSLGWGLAISLAVDRLGSDRTATRVAQGAALGVGIAALDLGLVARWRYPDIADLPVLPQVADHAAFGAAVALLSGGGRATGR